jgi:hypothetical protein
MGTSKTKAKKLLACTILLVAMGLAAIGGASVAAPHGWGNVPVAHAECDGHNNPPEPDCPAPTPTPK